MLASQLQTVKARAASLPTPVRWLLIAFIVLFVVGPGLSFLIWWFGRGK